MTIGHLEQWRSDRRASLKEDCRSPWNERDGFAVPLLECNNELAELETKQMDDFDEFEGDGDVMERLVPGQFFHLITTVISGRSVAFLAQLQLQLRRVVETTDTTLFVQFIFAGHVTSDRCDDIVEREG